MRESFREVLDTEKEKEYFKDLTQFIDKEYEIKTIFPPRDMVMNSMKYTPLKTVRVVIVGQDPYHGEKEAHGLSFSVNPGIKIPPSLMNIYKELNTEMGLYIPNNGYLMKWAKQGVLLLNSVLTVEKDTPGSHRNKGWETFTNEVIKAVNEKDTPVVFLLWGNYAKEKKNLITNPIHLILEASHPSPFSARYGFFGCNHFIKTNEFLEKNNIPKIDWQIENI